MYVNSPVPTHTAPAINWDTGEEMFDFFNRDGKQSYRGLVAEVRVYNNLADFGGSYERIYNELREKWMGDFRSPVVHLDASSLELESGDFVNQWGGLASEGQPKFLTDQTPLGASAVQFDGDDHFGQVELKSSDEAGFVFAAVLKPEQTDGYHNLIDDDDSNRPMVWIDNRDPQSYEANFGVGGDGPHLPPTNSGLEGWDILILDSKSGNILSLIHI